MLASSPVGDTVTGDINTDLPDTAAGDGSADLPDTAAGDGNTGLPDTAADGGTDPADTAAGDGSTDPAGTVMDGSGPPVSGGTPSPDSTDLPAALQPFLGQYQSDSARRGTDSEILRFALTACFALWAGGKITQRRPR